MKVKEAVATAKDYIERVFAAETVSQLALEEVEFDEASDCWLITIGFLREADRTAPGLERLLPNFANSGARLERIYRIVRIRDSDGVVASVKIRDLAA